MKLKLPYDIEFRNILGSKLLHKTGTLVTCEIQSTYPNFQLKLSRTMFSTVLTFDNKEDALIEAKKWNTGVVVNLSKNAQ